MNSVKIMRAYYLVTVALLAGWSINLYLALSRPTLDWRDAADVPLLVVLSFTVVMLMRVRANLGAESKAVKVGRKVYVLAVSAVLGLVAAVLLGIYAHG